MNRIYYYFRRYLKTMGREKRQKLMADDFGNDESIERGEGLKKQYKNGPVEDRKCRDVIWCLIFLALLGAMGYAGAIGLMKGDPNLLAAPFDKDGHQCGLDDGYESFPKIYISNFLTDPSEITFVCVKECPRTSSQELPCKTTSSVTDCSQLKIYPSDTIVHLCYPKDIIEDFDFDAFMDVSVIQEYFSDLREGWPLILGMFGIALILSLLFSVFVRFCAGCFVWTFIVLFELLQICIGGVFFFIPDVTFLQDLLHYQDFPENLKDRDYQMGIAITCWAIALITFLIICCMLKQIRISIGIMKAAADFTRQECMTMLIPLFIVLLQIGFLALWLTCLLFIYSEGSKEVEPINGTPFGWVVWNDYIQWWSVAYVVGLFWVINFLDGLGCFWVSSSAAIWYFEDGQPSHPVTKSIGRSFLAAGSIALGSFIIAIVMLIRTLLQFLNTKLKDKTMGLDGAALPMRFILRCASCYLACFERFLRFLTQNAYIMIAITGNTFCTSAHEAFTLITRSAAQYAITHGTTKLFFNLGRIIIICVGCLIGYVLITEVQPYRSNIYSPVFLTVIFALICYPIASAFMCLFQMGANTILMCYCLELDLLDDGENPRCPTALRNFLRNYVHQSVSSEGG